MKKIFICIMFFILCFLVGCDETDTETSSNDEVITYVGLEDAHVYLGESFDALDGVTFTSSTQGDITSTVQTNEESDVLPLGVHIVTYQTHYENNEIFSVDRRVVVMYPEDESDNLLTNGDFTDNMVGWSHATYADYPSDVRFIIDPDLKRMQVIMTSASTMLSSPNIYKPNLELDSNQTYEISLLVSGTANTFFSIDIVELNPTLQVLGVILDTQTINVGIQDGEMQQISFTFTPLLSSTNANLRLMFGQDNGNSPTGEIYIDNVKLNIVND
ncbi:hypothetical protein KHQ81_11750 [Mycoplasmatota bacterium]|nr:hypothetical protein KHQ81_11750 [Mycoplasmatota bacterium]